MSAINFPTIGAKVAPARVSRKAIPATMADMRASWQAKLDSYRQQLNALCDETANIIHDAGSGADDLGQAEDEMANAMMDLVEQIAQTSYLES